MGPFLYATRNGSIGLTFAEVGGDIVCAGSFREVGPNSNRNDALNIALYHDAVCTTDLNSEGVVDGGDLTVLLGLWDTYGRTSPESRNVFDSSRVSPRRDTNDVLGVVYT